MSPIYPKSECVVGVSAKANVLSKQGSFLFVVVYTVQAKVQGQPQKVSTLLKRLYMRAYAVCCAELSINRASGSQ